ncbi:MAG: hypothetical protein NZ108_08765, partial [Bacteroidia bacterium]|nr:hypothetical protein [Bacteroidia bacterium]
MMKQFIRLFSFLLLVSVVLSCKKSEEPKPTPPTPTDTTTIQARGIVGFSFLNRLPGIWNGKLTSHHLGVFPEWVVDFRPIAESSLMGKSELDRNNDIFMGFFPVNKGTDSLLAFRNGGHFVGATRVSYLVVDSISESASRSYYRFVD